MKKVKEEEDGKRRESIVAFLRVFGFEEKERIEGEKKGVSKREAGKHRGLTDAVRTADKAENLGQLTENFRWFTGVGASCCGGVVVFLGLGFEERVNNKMEHSNGKGIIQVCVGLTVEHGNDIIDDVSKLGSYHWASEF